MAQLGTRTGRLAALSCVLVATAAVLLLRDAGSGAPAEDSPSILHAGAAPGADAAFAVQIAQPPASIEGARPEPLEPALEPGWARVPVADGPSDDARFDDEIYGRVFIARLRDAAGNTPIDLQVTASVTVPGPRDGEAGDAGAPGQAPRNSGAAPSLGQPSDRINLDRASPDPDGLWRWPIDEALGHAELRVTLELRSPDLGIVTFVTDGRADEVLDVRLPTGATLQGSFDPGPMAMPPDDLLISARWLWKDSNGGLWSSHVVTSIDAQHYRFERSVLGHVDVSLVVGSTWQQSLGFAPPLLSPGTAATWDIRCEDLADLVVQVVDADTLSPLPDAIVSLGERGRGDHEEWPAGPDGCAWFLGLDLEAPVTVKARCGSYVPAVVAVPDVGMQRPLRMVLPLDHGVQVPGRLVDAEGRGISGASVWLEVDAGRQSHGTFTDDSGRFMLERASPGRGQVLACAAEGIGSNSFRIDIAHGMASQTFTLLAAPHLAVRVRRADGRPLVNGTVTVLSLGQVYREPSQRLDGDGRADFGELEVQGEVLVSAHGDDPVDGVASRRLVLTPGQSQELQLVLARDPPPDEGLSPVRVELNAFDPRTPEPLRTPLWVKISPAAASDKDRDALIVRLATSERTLMLPRGFQRLDIGDPTGSWAVTKLALDTTSLADGAVIDVALVEAR